MWVCFSSNQAAHRGNQLGGGKRLHNDCVRVDMLTVFRTIRLQLAHREDDRERRRGGTGAQTFADLQPRVSRHKNVQDGDIRRMLGDFSQGLCKQPLLTVCTQ